MYKSRGLQILREEDNNCRTVVPNISKSTYHNNSSIVILCCFSIVFEPLGKEKKQGCDNNLTKIN